MPNKTFRAIWDSDVNIKLIKNFWDTMLRILKHVDSLGHPPEENIQYDNIYIVNILYNIELIVYANKMHRSQDKTTHSHKHSYTEKLTHTNTNTHPKTYTRRITSKHKSIEL